MTDSTSAESLLPTEPPAKPSAEPSTEFLGREVRPQTSSKPGLRDGDLEQILDAREGILEDCRRVLSAMDVTPTEQTDLPPEAADLAMLRRLEEAVDQHESASKISSEQLKELIKQLRESFAYETSHIITGWIRDSEEYKLSMQVKIREKANLGRIGAIAQMGNITHRLIGDKPEAFFPLLEGELDKACLPEELTEKIRAEAQRLAQRLYPDWRPKG